SVDVIRIASSWTVTGCHTTSMWLTAPHGGQTVSSPATVRGRVSVFEGAFTVTMLNIHWQPIARKRMQVEGQRLVWFTPSHLVRPARTTGLGDCRVAEEGRFHL